MCISYQGGKKRSAKQIIDALPPAEMFIDVFGGAGNVSTQAVRSGKYQQVIYNDLDSHLVNFLEMVRDKPEELAEYIEDTPFGRHLHDKLDDMLESDDKIESAAAVFFSCNFQNPAVVGKEGGWLRPRIRHKNSIAGANTSKRVQLEKLFNVSDVLKEIYFENMDAGKVLERYDGLLTYQLDSGNINKMFFLDPPYGKTISYRSGKSYVGMSLEHFFLCSPWSVALCCEEGDYPFLKIDYEFVRFTDSNGRNLQSFSGKDGFGLGDGMYVKIREGFENA